MITRLRAENFKSWKDTGELRLAPLTGLFGTNSSGKTSLIQILLMLDRTVDSADPNRVLDLGDDRSSINLGTFSDVIHGHRNDAPLNLSLSWDEPESLPRIKFFTGKQLRFDASITEKAKIMQVAQFVYSFGHYRFGMIARVDGTYGLVHDGYVLDVPKDWVALPAPIKCYDFPQEAVEAYPDVGFLRQFAFSLERNFLSLRHLGPLRQSPQRSYLWAGNRPFGVGRDGETAIQALIAGISERSALEPQVARWLKELRLIDSFRLQSIATNRGDYEVRVKSTSKSAEVLITDVGFGVSQILPVLVLCYYVPEGSTVILEQPEIHLHPSVQSGLADVLIDVVNNRKLQIIVESHSEHLLRRLQRRIGEGKLSSDSAALYFCDIENGESKATSLDFSDDGFIKNWPKDFFGDEMGDLAAMTEAAVRRHLSPAR